MKNDIYLTEYGSAWGSACTLASPNYNKCASEVSGPLYLGSMNQGSRRRQCSRKRGYGPDQAYCKQHAKRYES